MSNTETNYNCSFCAKPAADVRKLIAGPQVYICNECIDLCYGLLKGESAPKKSKKTSQGEADKGAETLKGVPSPKKIKEFLDQYIIGQDDAKYAVSVAVYNHYKRLENPVVDEVELEKSNILLLGPTGSGKTLVAQSIARLLDVPFAIADATSLTEAGYVGDDVESIVTRLLQSANYDVEKAERGIIYLDEIDKKARKSDGGSGGRDVSGEGVQQALLKLLEGAEIYVPANGGRKGPNTELYKINTKNILFICGGAFVGIDKIVEQSQKAGSAGIGFGAVHVGKRRPESSELLKDVEAEHLAKYGLIPELVGRLPIIAPLVELTDAQLMRVLTEPKNAVTKQFEKMFKLDGIELLFSTPALEEVAKRARERKTGARGLRAVLEKNLLKWQYQLPDLRDAGVIRMTIDGGVIRDGSDPLMEYKIEEVQASA